METAISIHALLAESDIIISFGHIHSIISIHALLAESDKDQFDIAMSNADISIHALLAESDV